MNDHEQLIMKINDKLNLWRKSNYMQSCNKEDIKVQSISLRAKQAFAVQTVDIKSVKYFTVCKTRVGSTDKPL